MIRMIDLFLVEMLKCVSDLLHFGAVVALEPALLIHLKVLIEVFAEFVAELIDGVSAEDFVKTCDVPTV